MKITLKGFRSHKSSTYKFDDGKVHFIAGESGVGKSNIFQAIAWALYGKIQMVYNIDNKTTKMWVKLELHNMVIYRQRCPKVFKVKTNGTTYEGEIAEQIITDTFGTKDEWIASSYIIQSHLHYFIDSSPADRMKLLTNIAFGGENVNRYIEKTKTLIKKCEIEVKVNQTIYDDDLEKYEQMIEDNNIDVINQLTAEEIKTLKSKSTEVAKSVKDKKIERDKINKDLATLKTMKSQQENLIDQRADIRNINQGEIEELKTKQKLYNDYQAIKKIVVNQKNAKDKKKLEINKITQYLSTCNITDTPPIYTHEEIVRAKDYITKYTSNINLANKQQINYNHETITKQIEWLETLIECQWMYETHNKYNKLQEEYNRSKIKLDELADEKITVEELETLKNELKDLERSKDILSCPHCKKGVSIKGKTLIKHDKNPFDHVAYNELSEKINDGIKYLETENKTISLQNQLMTIVLPIIPNGAQYLQDVNTTKRKINELKMIKFYDIPTMNPDFMAACMEWHRQTKEYENMKVDTLEDEEPEYIEEKKIENLTKLQTKGKLLDKQIIEITNKLDAFNIPIKTIGDIDKEIDILNKKITEIDNKLKLSQLTTLALSNYESLTKKCENLEQLKIRLRRLNEYKNILIKSECDTLDKLVKKLNNVIYIIASQIFDNKINVRISLYKTIKTKKTEKQEVHLEIKYKGGTFTSATQLSGGECERISLILVMAFNYISGSKLLILDESTSSLDPDKKDQCFDVIKKVLIGKTILITSHDGSISGDCDSITTVIGSAG